MSEFTKDYDAAGKRQAEREREFNRLFDQRMREPMLLPEEFRVWNKSYIEGAGIQLPISQVVGNFLVEDNTSSLGGNVHGRVGTVSFEDDFISLTYDAVNSRWISDPSVLTGQAGTFTTTSTSFTNITAMGRVTFQWRNFDTAGLKPQLRIMCSALTVTTGTATATISLQTVNEDESTITTTDPSWSITSTSSGGIARDSGWQDLPELTLTDFLATVPRMKSADGSTASITSGSAFVRWVSK